MDAVDLLGIADHPALELLNSTTDATGPHLEVITDGAGLLEWLTLSGLLSDEAAAAADDCFAREDLDAAADQARGFRERMRAVVDAWSDGKPTTAATITELNHLLALDSRHTVIARDRDGLRTSESHTWQSAKSLLALPAAAVADLITQGETGLVRHCEGAGCTMWFYDRTKGHRRRWCRMAVCGNRAKAANHRAKAHSTTNASTPH